MFQAIQAQGYCGGYGRVYALVRRLQQELAQAPSRKASVPLAFAHGEAFRFDWNCEYAWIGGLRRRLVVAHCELASSRAFWLMAYPSQGYKMLFDAHTRSFVAFGAIPQRGIDGNMKIALGKDGKGKDRNVNTRFEAMSGHYLFEPEFCNRAAGWERGIIEKNVQDRRRQIRAAAADLRWTSLA